MQFESFWPLLFLIAIPAIIILYLLKPKGEDHRFSSNLLWQKLLRNQSSKTFFEKFVHNILMYLQILLAALLVVALMSPYVVKQGKAASETLIVLDTSAGMQHLCGDGRTRLEAEVDAAKLLVDGTKDGHFSVITCDGAGSTMLVIGSGDTLAVKRALSEVRANDTPGDMTLATGAIDSLYMDEDGNTASVCIFTDGTGAAKATEMAKLYEAAVTVVGDAVSNIALDYLTFSKVPAGDGERSAVDAAVGVTNYSDTPVTFELSISGDDGSVLAIRQASLAAGASGMTLFDGVDFDGEYLKAEATAVSFADGGADSLKADNVCYAVAQTSSDVTAAIAGSGNTYIEKAFRAVTGNNMERIDAAGIGDGYDFVVYEEAGTLNDAATNRLAFVKPGTLNEESTGRRLSVTPTVITDGFALTEIGVNACEPLELPEWGQSFLTSAGESMGYFGEHDGIREIVVGFDLRESDFALTADFPVFMANAVNYLSDGSLLAENTYTAGQSLSFRAVSGVDVAQLYADLSMCGIYSVEAEGFKEYYTVRFPVRSASDGRITAEGTYGGVNYRAMSVQQTLRRIFLIAALVLLVAEWAIYLYQNRYRGRFYWISRAVGTALLICAIAGITFTRTSRENVTIFVVDLSQSNLAAKDAMEEDLKKFVSKMPSKNRYGVVAFGKDAQVDRFLTEDTGIGDIMSMPDATATDLSGAISRAVAMIPSDAAGRIVVLSDGRQTRGNVQDTARALAASDVELLALLYPSQISTDAYIEDVSIPTYLHPGDLYSVRVTVESNYETDADLVVRNGSLMISQSRVHLTRGSNSYVLQQTVTGENLESFTVSVNAKGDTCEENNAYTAYAVVEAPPRILLVSGTGEDSTNAKAVLEATGYEYTVVSAVNAPENINDMLYYRTIILENAYIGELPQGFLDNIEAYVRDYGYGLVCIGGENAYAMGGYKKTVLETVLPVDMTLTGTNQQPSMDMVMVIDHSGSMSADVTGGGGATALDLAIEAAKVAVDNLEPNDKVGVLTFDDQYTWQVTLQEVGTDTSGLHRQLENVPDGGGTSIQPALEEAIRILSEDESSLKHIILLTDGQGESDRYDKIINECREQKITLSTVAVGEGADYKSLGRLARDCNGRAYVAENALEVPKIFAEEVYLSGDSYIQNGEFTINGAGANKLVSGLYSEGWPILKGYIATTAKGAAQTVLTSDKYDPVLVSWQYGLGHSVAWTSDITGEWTSGYVGTEDFPAMWRRIIDYACGSTDMGEDDVTVTTRGGLTTITYTAKDFNEQTAVAATYIRPDQTTGETVLYAVAPGVYEAEIEAEDAGLYAFTVRRTQGSELAGTLTTAAAVQYSDEYKYNIKSTDFEKFVEGCGKMIQSGDDIWKKRSTSSRETKDLTTLFLILTVVWLLADVAGRRFGFVPKLPERKKAANLRQADGNAKPAAPADDHGENNSGKPDKPAGDAPKPAKSPKKSAAAPTLDTSGLLKKKSERNI